MIVPINGSPVDLDPSVLSNEIALDEALDALDPLRHLRGDESLEDDGDSPRIIPVQLRSTYNELIRLSFPDRGCSTAVYVVLKVDASPGCGGIAWPAGEVLANYLAFRGERCCAGKTILELGSGTGLVGLVAGRLGGRVWITDQAPLLDIMHANVQLNQLESSVVVSELNWGETLPPGIPRPDLILAADCVYFEPTFPLLVKTLSELATERTELLFCYKKRRKADKRFFTLLKKEFDWREIEDDPSRERYNREAISLLMLHRKPRSSRDLFGDSSAT
ncbi:putative methyltransferase-domain-containing protein [Boletus coccyginus]|nr:putative methyltransferase-domain-containing protein [Boletus coccyginus]